MSRSSSRSPSGYSDQLDHNGHYIQRTEIYTEYQQYVSSHSSSKQAATRYHTEWSSRNRNGPSSSGEAPLPTKSTSSRDWQAIGRYSGYKEDHRVLGTYASEASSRFATSASDRENFNVKYRKVLEKKNEWQGHVDQAQQQRASSKKFAQKETVHKKYYSK